jgi:glycerophosphoryl diester phosphodiesterase
VLVHSRAPVLSTCLASCFLTCTLAGCGFIASGNPGVIAHRAGAGNWPENSRTAVRESVAAGYAGIEVDVTLTSDGVPILAHEPWINEVTCETTLGEPVQQRFLIRDYTLDQLNETFLCGGRRDPDHPEAMLVADTVLPLDELLSLIAEAPSLLLYLDTKYDPRFTPDAEMFAEQIAARLDAADLPNPVVVESTLAEGATAFRERGLDVALGWPRFAGDDDGIVTTLSKELTSGLGVESGIGAATDVDAQALTLPYQLVDWQMSEAAHDAGLDVYLFTLNDESTLGAFCNWPADYLMTDYPERATCQR